MYDYIFSEFYNVEEEIKNINFITFMYSKRDWARMIKEII